MTLLSVKILIFLTCPSHSDDLSKVHKTGGVYGRATEEGSRPPGCQPYFVQYLSLSVAPGSPRILSCRRLSTRGAKASWKLITIAEEPSGYGLFLVWDTSGFFSG